MSRFVFVNGVYGSVLKGWGIESIKLLDKEVMMFKIGNMFGNGKDIFIKYRYI